MHAAIQCLGPPPSWRQHPARLPHQYQSSPVACCRGCCHDYSAAIPDTTSSPPQRHVPGLVPRFQSAESGQPTPCRRSPAPLECCLLSPRAAPSHPPLSTEALRESPPPSPHRKSSYPSADSA